MAFGRLGLATGVVRGGRAADGLSPDDDLALGGAGFDMGHRFVGLLERSPL